MALIVKIDSASDLRREFRRFGRENTFTTEGYQALIELFEGLGRDVETDVIGLCCDFAEVTVGVFIKEYNIPHSSFDEWCEETGDNDDDNYHSYLVMEAREYVEKHGFWFEFLDDLRIIYQCF